MRDERCGALHPIELFFIVGLMQTVFVSYLGLLVLMNSPFGAAKGTRSMK